MTDIKGRMTTPNIASPRLDASICLPPFLVTRLTIILILPLVLLLSASRSVALELTPAPPTPCAIEIIESGSGWPVPLVELVTTHRLKFISDNAGRIAIDAPELMGREVWFDLHGEGYEVAKDGFGYRGRRLRIEPGARHRIEVNRTIVARRFGRITGAGLFSESQKLGLERNWNESGVFGCDSVQNALHDGKMFWVWGDTTLPGYPLGIFQATAATSSIPKPGSSGVQIPGLPPLRLNLDWFVNSNGAPRAVVNIPGTGPTWLSGLVSLPDGRGKPRLGALYAKIKPPLATYEYGLAEWDDARAQFERLRILWRRDTGATNPPPLPDGHAVLWKDPTGKEWALFGNPFPTLRCRATFESWQSPESWEPLKPQPVLEGTVEGRKIEVKPHTGAIAYHQGRSLWVTIFMQSFGKPSAFGELWYAEANAPTGPWGAAVKVLSHENYTFYNPALHPEFSNPSDPVLFFEGTYTREFSSNPTFTPRYDYNQVLYRLDLMDPALAPARAGAL